MAGSDEYKRSAERSGPSIKQFVLVVAGCCSCRNSSRADENRSPEHEMNHNETAELETLLESSVWRPL